MLSILLADQTRIPRRKNGGGGLPEVVISAPAEGIPIELPPVSPGVGEGGFGSPVSPGVGFQGPLPPEPLPEVVITPPPAPPGAPPIEMPVPEYPEPIYEPGGGFPKIPVWYRLWKLLGSNPLAQFFNLLTYSPNLGPTAQQESLSVQQFLESFGIPSLDRFSVAPTDLPDVQPLPDIGPAPLVPGVTITAPRPAPLAMPLGDPLLPPGTIADPTLAPGVGPTYSPTDQPGRKPRGRPGYAPAQPGVETLPGLETLPLTAPGVKPGPLPAITTFPDIGPGPAPATRPRGRPRARPRTPVPGVPLQPEIPEVLAPGTVLPNVDAGVTPLTQFGPETASDPCQAQFAKQKPQQKKKPKKHPPRQVCHTGTYRELAKGLRKHPTRVIPCQ